MKLTQQQLESSETQCRKMFEGFRSRKIARNYKEFQRGGKKLLYIGPRLCRNVWMMVKEIKRLRQEREEMVEALKLICNSTMSMYVDTDIMAADLKLTAYGALRQVGELE